MAKAGQEKRSLLDSTSNQISAKAVSAEDHQGDILQTEKAQAMAKRSRRIEAEDFTELKQFASPLEIALATRRFQRCLSEVRALRRESVHFDHERVRTAQFNIRVAILETFGPDSPEFGEYRDYVIYSRMPRSAPSVGLETFRNVNQARFVRELPQTESMLTGLIGRLNEKRTELLLPSRPQSRVAFEHLKLHPLIADACGKLYRDGHYRQAVLDASIALANSVKNKSGRGDIDGASLMRTVFSRNDPVLAFNTLRSRSGEDEQEGMMHLFEGAVLAFRNSSAHTLSDWSPDAAICCLAFLSLLATRLDNARRRA